MVAPSPYALVSLVKTQLGCTSGLQGASMLYGLGLRSTRLLTAVGKHCLACSPGSRLWWRDQSAEHIRGALRINTWERRDSSGMRPGRIWASVLWPHRPLLMLEQGGPLQSCLGVRTRAQVFTSLHGPSGRGTALLRRLSFIKWGMLGAQHSSQGAGGGMSTPVLKGGLERHTVASTALI